MAALTESEAADLEQQHEGAKLVVVAGCCNVFDELENEHTVRDDDGACMNCGNDEEIITAVLIPYKG